MQADRRATTAAGVLAIVGIVAGVLSVVPVIEEPAFLTRIPRHEGQVLMGAGFQLLMIPASIGFALCLYPTLRMHSGALSVGFVGFRFVAATFHLIGVALLPLFLPLGQALAEVGGSGAAGVVLFGDLLRTGRDLVNHVALITALSMGDVLLFALLYRRRLVAGWLSAWGLFGAGLSILASLLVLFGLADIVGVLYLAMNAPLALQSVVFAGWLITRGFASTASQHGQSERLAL